MTLHNPILRSVAAVSLAGLVLAGCSSDDETENASSATAPLTASASSECSLESLSGSYLYEVHGDQRFKEGFVPYLEVGLMVFDGKGGLERVGTDSGTREESTTSMTYEVDKDCTGTMSAPDGSGALSATVSPSGSEVSFFAAGSGDTQSALDGSAERVGDSGISCEESTLSGTYQYRSRGVFGGKLHIEHGFEVFDGKGGATNAFRVAGVDQVERLQGTYTVGTDCRATVTYSNGVTLDQYLAPGGSEFYWIQTDGFELPGLFGGHEQRVSTSTDKFITTGS